LRLGRRFPDQHKVARRIEFATARAHASILSERVSEIDRQLQFWTSSGRLLVDLADSFDDASVAHSTPFTWTETRPRLEVDRLTNGPVSGLLFDSSRHRFVAKGGWSLAAEIERGAEGRFVGALNLLGHQGVGQDRTVGQGGFEVVGTEELPDDVLIRPQDGRKPPKAARMLLSLCHPTPEDVRNGILHGAYVLTERAGWVTNAGRTSLRRAAVTMMAEGSWYPNDAGTSPGDVVKALDPLPDEGLDHPVYRDGRGLTVQVSAGEELR
jgi:CRISPR type III-A-associated RAMP protein Csm4